MSKMIEAAEKKYGMRWRELSMDIQEDFESGWVAAIAAVKEGGVHGFIGQHGFGAPLYKLPEDV